MKISTHFIVAPDGIRSIVRSVDQQFYFNNIETDRFTVTFSAATVLLAACKCPDVAVSVGDSGFEKDWARCLFILHHYEDQIQSATQAIQVLEVMKQSVSGNGFPSQRTYRVNHDVFILRTMLTPSAASSSQQQNRSPFSANYAMAPPNTQQHMNPVPASNMPNFNTMPVDLQGVNPFMPGMDSMSDAWFGQQLLNMDWLDPNMPLQPV